MNTRKITRSQFLRTSLGLSVLPASIGTRGLTYQPAGVTTAVIPNE